MNIESIYEYLDHHMSEKRRRHTEGVRKTALSLAAKWGADPDKAVRAALYHDIYRGCPIEELDQLVLALGLDEHRYLHNANLSHGRIAASMLPELFGERDQEVINAVRYHTTGRSQMSLLEKVIFLADAIEPSRDYPGVEQLRKAADIDLDLGCLLSLSGTIRNLMEQGMLKEEIDQDTLEAEVYFKDLLEKKWKIETWPCWRLTPSATKKASTSNSSTLQKNHPSQII